MKQLGTPALTAELMKKYRIAPSKALGQNFLIDPNVLDKIVHLAELSSEDGVIEVGPGLGALTARLIQGAGSVVAVELDRKLHGVLQELFLEESGLHLYHADALEVDYEAIIRNDFPPQAQGRVKVVANIPYSITSPLVAKILEEISPKLCVLMVQYEVARRMAAVPGGKEYGSFSVFCQYHSKVTVAFKVPSSVFIPRPEVDSAVALLVPREEKLLPPDQESGFFRMVQTIFTVRRKTLVNGMLLLPELAGDRSRALGIIASLGWPEKVRAETLFVEEFVTLYQAIYG